MQLRYVYSELGQGLRRNLTMHLAVILTLVVSLTLVGIGLLFQQQATRAAELFGEELFSGDNPALTAEDMPQTIWITLEDPEQYEGISSAVQGLDGVSRV